MNKTCSKCKVEKTIESFHKHKANKNGVNSWCKICKNGNDSKWRLTNPDHTKEWKVQYRDRHLELERNYHSKRRATDPLYKLSCNIRSLICTAYRNKGYKKNSKTQKILGCDFASLKAHLESTFIANYGYELKPDHKVHIDHIIPTSIARDEAHLKELNHFTNLQLLFAEDNLAKSDSLNFKLN